MTRWSYGFVVVMILLFHYGMSPAEEKSIHSMGLPSRNEFYGGPMVVFDQTTRGTQFGGQLYAGWTRYLASPLFGVGVGLEGYGQWVDDQDFDGGGRLVGKIAPIFLQAGVDYNIGTENAAFILSLNLPLRRGGIFGHGSELRVDWLPTRNQTFNVGLQFYFGQPTRGKARPKQAKAVLPKVSSQSRRSQADLLSPDIQQLLDAVAHAADWINRYTTPFLDQEEIEGDRHSLLHTVHALKAHLNLRDEQYPDGHHFNAEIAMYHQMLEQAFGLAAGDADQGRQISNQVRKRLFQDVILPYNRLLGRRKKHDSVLGYGEKTGTQLKSWLDDTQELSESQQGAVMAIFGELLNIIEKNRAFTKAEWGGEELVWLPLQYGLHPDQYDTRDDMNHLIEVVAEESFSDANKIYYVINEQFQPETSRMILRAEDYHVLWIHDYRGVNTAGSPDSISFRQTVHVYFQALLNAVRNYDETGKIPVYLIFIDQYFYEVNDGRFWLKFLESPLDYHLRLPKKYQDWVQEFTDVQEELKQAVAASERLQEDARNYGKHWMKNTVKVHVNVTNRADVSFRSGGLFTGLPFIPDDAMRDHRKLSFYDISEEDPGKGAALYSGMGIGEQYSGPTWDDRAMLVQGPVLLSLKDEARRLLEQQGFSADQIPDVLRRYPKPGDYPERLDALRHQGWTASLMEVHNQTGFRRKQLNAVKATLYTLMPPGSTIVIPDGFWNAPLFSSFLVGAALRGCQVLTIAPSPENSTFTGAFPLQSRTQELLSRLILVQQGLKEELASVGGMLKVGIYNRNANLGDPKIFDEFAEGIRKNPFVKELFPFPEEVYTLLEKLTKEIEASDYQPAYLSKDGLARKPKLHMKINFFLSDEVKPLLAQPGWDDFWRGYIEYREKFMIQKDHYVDVKDVPESLRETFNEIATRYRGALNYEERQKAMGYLTIGSQNHNYRSLIMDGEVALVAANAASLTVLMDMFFLSGITIWIDDLETLETYIPGFKGWKRRFSRYMMKAL
ncbi:MAG: hypothetical protein GY801_07535 [bacterium]|nr:hypothetical protein [bacterium]